MAILTDDMKRVIAEQRLGFVATVCPDGTPNLSPKGTTAVWDDDHLVFADICSPATIGNLTANPAIAVNVVDVTLRKGYRFKGTAAILTAGPVFEAVRRRTSSPVRHVVLMTVVSAAAVTSPAYDLGDSERDIAQRWDRHWGELRRNRGG